MQHMIKPLASLSPSVLHNNIHTYIETIRSVWLLVSDLSTINQVVFSTESEVVCSSSCVVFGLIYEMELVDGGGGVSRFR